MDNGLLVMAVVLTIFVIALWQGQEASIRNQEGMKERCIVYGYFPRELLIEQERKNTELTTAIEKLAKKIEECERFC